MLWLHRLHMCLMHDCCLLMLLLGRMRGGYRARRDLLRVRVRHDLRLLMLLELYGWEVAHDAFAIVGLSSLDLGAVEHLHLAIDRFANHDSCTLVVILLGHCLGELVRPPLIRCTRLYNDLVGYRRAIISILVASHVHHAILGDLGGWSLLEILVSVFRINLDGLRWASRVSSWLIRQDLNYILLLVNQLHILRLEIIITIREVCQNLTTIRGLVLWQVVLLVTYTVWLRWTDRRRDYGLLQLLSCLLLDCISSVWIEMIWAIICLQDLLHVVCLQGRIVLLCLCGCLTALFLDG